MISPIDLRLFAAAAGSWAVCLLALKTPLAPWAIAALAVIGIAATLWPRREARHRTPWRGWVSQTVALGALISVAVGIVALAQIHKRDEAIESLLDFSDADIRYTLTLTSEVAINSSGLGAHANLTSATSPGRRLDVTVPVYVVASDPRWPVGQRVTVRGALAKSRGTVYLRVRQTLREERLSGVTSVIVKLRHGVRAASDGLPPYPRGLLPGVSIGDTRGVPLLLDQSLKTTSLAHVTAVSGAHVSIVLASVLAVVARARPIVKGVIALSALAMMVLVVLPTASVLRASSMGALTLLGLITTRPRLALPVLFAVVAALLAWDPWLAGSIGFALSAVVTAGILTLSEPIAAWLRGGLAARVVAVPIAAQLACAPLLLTFDPSIAIYSVPANMLAMPALAPATIFGLASAVASLASEAVAAVLAGIGAYFVTWIGAVALFFADLPGARMPWFGGAMGVLSLMTLNIGAVVLIVRGARPRT